MVALPASRKTSDTSVGEDRRPHILDIVIWNFIRPRSRKSASDLCYHNDSSRSFVSSSLAQRMLFALSGLQKHSVSCQSILQWRCTPFVYQEGEQTDAITVS